jgi:3-hydroxyacyl-[acyl-carrier-protein] dehydratase
MKLDIKQILQLMPHRYPILLVDRVLELEPGVRIAAIKNVSVNEPHFQGHFPGHPVMPGVLIIEAMAQTGALLALHTLGEERERDALFFFVGIDGARFKRQVLPGDQLMMEVTLIRYVRNVGKFKATAHVGGQLACEGELMCARRPVAAVDAE